MNRSLSELCFQKFLEGSESESTRAQDGLSESDDVAGSQPSDGADPVEIDDVAGSEPSDDPTEYAAMLKKKLDVYCAAVAKSRGSQESSSFAESGTTTASQLVSQASFNANEMMNNLGGTNSCSSEGDPETENGTLDNEKKNKRMLSNRESARRSRKRKQVHLTDLESQVSQLRVENASLVKRLSEMTQNYTDASVGNRTLKADIETLKAKVKMAEQTVKRVTDMCDTSAFSISDASIPQKEEDINITHFFHHNNNNNNNNNHNNNSNNINMRDENQGIEIPVSDRKLERSGSVQRVASLERLQNRMCINQWEAAT